MEGAPGQSLAKPAIVLGLTFLLIGLTFAIPLQLTSRPGPFEFSKEVSNVYACVAWAGWAHFLYAFRGQFVALTKSTDKLVFTKVLVFAIVALLSLAMLAVTRWAITPAVFGAVTWIYFIDHFIKAEEHFEGHLMGSEPIWKRWIRSYQPLMTFGWLTMVLLNIANVTSNMWLLWGMSLSLAAMVFVFGGWNHLSSGRGRIPLVCLFFIAEALVWGAFTRYGGSNFLKGVYAFHIAAGSYFHYLGSYFYGIGQSRGEDKILHPATILVIHVAIFLLGFWTSHNEPIPWLEPILSPAWFTLWVAFHLVMSDFFPMIRKLRTREVAKIR